MPDKPRVQFAHGLDSSPHSRKAQVLAQHFEACTPEMDTSNFESCVSVHADCLASFRPDVLVGSSFGGAIALALLQRGQWTGPTLLLAQAGLRCGLPPMLPSGIEIWLVHGTLDTVIDPEDSRRLAAAAGTSSTVRLIEVDDDHVLGKSVANGDFADWVRALAS